MVGVALHLKLRHIRRVHFGYDVRRRRFCFLVVIQYIYIYLFLFTDISVAFILGMTFDGGGFFSCCDTVYIYILVSFYCEENTAFM